MSRTTPRTPVDPAESPTGDAAGSPAGKTAESPAGAGRYTHGHHASVLAAHATRTAATSCAYLLPHLDAGMSLLDVGCGPGSVTIDLADRLSPGRVVGLDFAESAIGAARAAVASRGLPQLSSLEFRQGSVYELPFPDDSFDVVHAHQVLQHLSDPVAALAEMERVAAPGGLVAVRDVDYGSMRWHPESPGIAAWLEAYRTIARRNGGDPDAGLSLRAWAQRAGLPDDALTVTATTWCYADPASVAWWGTSQADRVLHAGFAEQALREGWSQADVDAMAAGWRAWSDAPDATFTMSHTELLATVPA